MWITTFIMFAASTCHLVLQWIGNMDTIVYELRVLAPHQLTGSNDPAAPDNDLANLIQEIGGLYLPIINVSFPVSSFLTLVDHFAVFHERWNCTLEGMDHVGTQRESLDISCASCCRVHR